MIDPDTIATSQAEPQMTIAEVWPINSPALIALDSFAGRTLVPCRIIGHTNKRVRVELLSGALIGRTHHKKGEARLVPAKALRKEKASGNA